MKKLLMTLGVAATLVSGAALAAGNPAEATVTFNGKVTATTCNFSTDSVDKQVNLDPIDYRELQTKPGKGKNRTSFKMVLENCPIMTSERQKNAVLVFDAPADTAQDGLLLNTAAKEVAAENVGIQLWDTTTTKGDGKLLLMARDGMNKVVQPLANATKDGTLTYDLVAAYYPTKLNAVTPGLVTARVPVKIEYK